MIDETTMEILRKCTQEDKVIKLPPGQLSRDQYKAFNSVMAKMGGKWNRKYGGHVFEFTPDLEAVVSSGDVKDIRQTYQYFPTPEAVANVMLNLHHDIWLDYSRESVYCEPSCGGGSLLGKFPAPNPTFAVEIHEPFLELAKENVRDHEGITWIHDDFLNTNLAYDAVIMNPPFKNQQDIKHLQHAWKGLRMGGVLVSVIFPTSLTRTTKLSDWLREWFKDNHATRRFIEPGAFKESGTDIPVEIVAAVKK